MRARFNQLESSFVDIAATLGTARYGDRQCAPCRLVLQHRAELKEGCRTSDFDDVAKESCAAIYARAHDGKCQALMAHQARRGAARTPSAGVGGRFPIGAAIDSGSGARWVQSVRQMSHLLYPRARNDFGALAAIESMAKRTVRT